MPTLSNGSANITVTKQTGTVLTVLANETYVDCDPEFNISVQQGVGAANTASADVSVDTASGSAGGTNIGGIVGTKTTTEPTSGYYIKMNASGSGSSKITTAGWMNTGSLGEASTQATKYFPISPATITQKAPTIDSSTGIVTAEVQTTAGYTPASASAASNTLQLTTTGATTYNTNTSDQTIAAGTYLTGAQTIRAVTTANIDAANIKDGVNVQVGDSNSAGRIKNVTGTFTDASTVSSGQTAAGAAQIMSGYSAWVDGAEVQGSMSAKTASDVTVSGKSVTIPAGSYASDVVKSVNDGSVVMNTPTINTSTGVVTASADVSEGYVSGAHPTQTLQLTTQAGATIVPTRSEQTAVTAGKYTIGVVKIGAIPSNYYTMQEVYPVYSLYVTTGGTDPSITLGFGTWQLIRSMPYRWLDVATNTWYDINDSSDWSFADKVADNIYVYQRTA